MSNVPVSGYGLRRPEIVFAAGLVIGTVLGSAVGVSVGVVA
ncbi:hypothetical protein [Halomicrobium salinisoli]|nr:hypothetical protein [Halomicrobium salinisoli]